MNDQILSWYNKFVYGFGMRTGQGIFGEKRMLLLDLRSTTCNMKFYDRSNILLCFSTEKLQKAFLFYSKIKF